MTDNKNNRKTDGDDIFDSLDLGEETSLSPAAEEVFESPLKAADALNEDAEFEKAYGKKKKTRELNTAQAAVDRSKVSSEKATKKRSKLKKIILWAVLEIVTLSAIFTYGYFLRSWNLITRPEVNESNIENHNLSAEKKEQMERGYWTFAVFGVDGRNASDLVSRGLNSDVIMICNINLDNGEIRLCSIFRDTYLNINEKNSYRKINQAYSEGGPEQALAAINKNLDLNLKHYVTFNWKAVADGINILGGIDGIDISKAELYYINAFITETVKVTKIGSVQLKSTGVQHLDGVQAVAYGRLRLMDDDFARTERQKKVIKACFEKAKGSSFSVLNNIMVVCFPEVATNINFNDVVTLAQNITKYNITESGGFPWQRSEPFLSSVGDVVVPATLDSNVRRLHQFLFGDEDYQPSAAVLKYSETIKEKTHVYKEGQVVESVRTDGGLIGRPRTEAPSSAVSSGEGRTTAAETDEDGNVVEKLTIGVDEDGNLIYPTDEDGETVVPTDEYGNVVYPTDEDGSTVYPTDEDGNPIIPETRPGELESGGRPGPGESSHGDDGPVPEGPGGHTQETTSGTGGPGNHTQTTETQLGPGVTPEEGGSSEAGSTGSSGTVTDPTSDGSAGSDVPGNPAGSESSSGTNEPSPVPGGSDPQAPGGIAPGGTGGPGGSSGPVPGDPSGGGSSAGPGDPGSGGSSPGDAPLG